MSPQVFLTYDSGPFSFGIVAEYFSYHRGPESQRLQVDRAAFPASDVVSTDGGVFLKYNNGRYFFNAELDWINKTTKFQRSLNGTFFGSPDRTDGRGSLFAPRYIEAWRWMVETGFMAGPAKASFIYAWLPGPDRRNGVLIDRQPYFYGFANNGLFMPYSLVMNFYYGARLGFVQPEHGRLYERRLDFRYETGLCRCVQPEHLWKLLSGRTGHLHKVTGGDLYDPRPQEVLFNS